MRILVDYLGRKIKLTNERWEHILAHREMVDLKDAVEETLAAPQLVVQSRSDESVLLNYRRYLETSLGDKWLCVVVKFKDKDDAFVLTAYLTDKPKKGRQRWPRK